MKKSSKDIQIDTFESVNFTALLLFNESVNICAIIMSGSMDAQPVLEFQNKMKKKFSKGKYNYIVDLNHVRYISSTGLGLLMFLASRRKKTLYLSSPHKGIVKPLKILGIHSMFVFYSNIEELKKKAKIPDTLIEKIKEKIQSKKDDIQMDERWVKMLKDHLAYVAIVDEAQGMLPYIEKANKEESISLPSDEKYTCILYKFLEKIFRKVAKFDKMEIDDVSLEIIAKELMSNAVRHGYDYKKEGVVEATYKIDNKKLEIYVIDYGKGFTISSSKTSPSTGLKLLEKLFNDLSISEAPKKEVQGLVLGKGTMIKLIKNLIPEP